MYNRYSLFFFITDNTVVSLEPMSCIQEVAWRNTQVWLRSRDLNGQPQSSPHTLNLSICSPRTPITEQTNREESRCCNWDKLQRWGTASYSKEALIWCLLLGTLGDYTWCCSRLKCACSLVIKPLLRKTKFTEAFKAEGVEGASKFTAPPFCNCFSSN